MNKILLITSLVATIAGISMVLGGIFGVIFTYKNVAREDIITPADASIPNTPVRGPFTLKSQSDIIRKHVFQTTGEKTYSQMPQKISKTDQGGNSIMVENSARNIWITATTLTTALHLGILSYLFSGLVIFLGIAGTWVGILLFFVIKK